METGKHTVTGSCLSEISLNYCSVFHGTLENLKWVCLDLEILINSPAFMTFAMLACHSLLYSSHGWARNWQMTVVNKSQLMLLFTCLYLPMLHGLISWTIISFAQELVWGTWSSELLEDYIVKEYKLGSLSLTSETVAYLEHRKWCRCSVLSC